MTTLEELLRTRVARFVDRQPDWDAFADARVEGYRRAQHRYIGAGASGKTDARAIPAEQFTLSVMFVPPGQGNAAHTHEVEEVFFILDGKVKVFFVDSAGRREETVLGRWDCVSAPAGVVHGFENVGLEPAYLAGHARPRTAGSDELRGPGTARATRRPPRSRSGVIALAASDRKAGRGRRPRALATTCDATASAGTRRRGTTSPPASGRGRARSRRGASGACPNHSFPSFRRPSAARTRSSSAAVPRTCRRGSPAGGPAPSASTRRWRS